jgi:hypothetical protein
MTRKDGFVMIGKDTAVRVREMTHEQLALALIHSFTTDDLGMAALLGRWLDLWDEHPEYARAGQMLDAYEESDEQAEAGREDEGGATNRGRSSGVL